jgi:hypothetical protein
MLLEGSLDGRSASADLSGSSMGGALGPDSLPDPVPRAGGITIKGKCGVVILEDRDDDYIGKQCWAMPQCLQMHAATNTSNASFPSTRVAHKCGHKHVVSTIFQKHLITFIYLSELVHDVLKH